MTATDRIINLTEGSITAKIIKLALPIIATSFMHMAYNLTDMFWVGRIGSHANAAVGSVGMYMWMSASFSLMCKVGSEVCIGQAIGRKDYAEARLFASHNITIALLVSLACAAVMAAFATPLIGIYKLSPSISADAVSYFRIVSIGVPFIFLASAFTGIYNACGRSAIPFYITGTGLVTNIILDPIFIFWLGMGTDGAAIATVIAQVLVVALFLWQMRLRDKLLGNFKMVAKLTKAATKRVIKIGAPVAAFNSLFAFASMFLSRIASLHGGHIGLMTFTTGGQIEAITWNTSQGFSTALGAFTAQNYAAGRGDRVFKGYGRTLLMSLVFGLAGTVLFVFYGQELFAIFVPEQAAYISGGKFLRIDGYSQLLMMLEIATQGVFYGIGRTMPPAIISVTGNYLRIPLALWLVTLMGVEGIWWAVSISSMLKGAVLFAWLMAIRKSVYRPAGNATPQAG